MIVLDTTDSLKAALGGAVTTNELPIVASYVDVAAPDIYDPNSAHTLTSGAADVTAVAAPAAGKRRQVKFLSVFNKDTVSATVTIKFDRSATQRELVKIALAASSTLVYTDGEGFRVIDTAGVIQ